MSVSPADTIIPRAPSDVLNHLLRVCDQVLVKPYLAFGFKDAIDDIGAEVTAHLKRPVDGERYVDDFAGMLVASLRNVANDNGPVKDGPRDKWVGVATTLAACVRERAIAAHAAEQLPPASDGGRFR